VLAWLAVRSLRDQQFLLERQQSLLCQRVTDALAQNIADYLAQQQQEFSAQVETLVGDQDARTVGSHFDSEICQRWPLADGGFLRHAVGKNPFAISQRPRRGEEFLFGQRRVSLGNRETRRGLWQREYGRDQFIGLHKQQRQHRPARRVWGKQFWRQPEADAAIAGVRERRRLRAGERVNGTRQRRQEIKCERG